MLFTKISMTGSWVLVVAAIAGSTGVLMLVLLISLSIRDSMTLLIIGLMIGSFSGAMVSVLQYYGEAQEIQSYLLWTFGNLGGVHKQELVVLAITVIIGLIGTWMIAKPLNALLLGEAYAKATGNNDRAAEIMKFAEAFGRNAGVIEPKEEDDQIKPFKLDI